MLIYLKWVFLSILNILASRVAFKVTKNEKDKNPLLQELKIGHDHGSLLSHLNGRSFHNMCLSLDPGQKDICRWSRCYGQPLEKFALFISFPFKENVP